VLHCTTNECPTSLISADSIRLLSDYHDNRAAHETTGASLYGLDSGRWPAYYFDAVTTLTYAQREADALESGA
jgi:hypothetical protein